MKKNLLALFVLGAIYSASAQTAYIKDKAVVAVKSNTLLYMGNGLEISSTEPNTIINEGNIQINLSNLNGSEAQNLAETTPYFFRNYNTGKTYVSGTENVASDWNDGSNFVNKYTGPDNYGQVMFTMGSYISGAQILTATELSSNRSHGKMTLERPFVDPNQQNWQVISIPFLTQTTKTTQTNSANPQLTTSINVNSDGYTDLFVPESIMSRFYNLTDTYIGDDSRSNSRYNSTLMFWRNDAIYYEGTLRGKTNEFAKPFNGNHIVNLHNGALKTLFSNNFADTSKRITYKGTPYSFNYSRILSAQQSMPYDDSTTWGEWKTKINQANEKYESYIGENFSPYADSDTKFGKYLFNISNPYTHNINVHQLLVNSTKSDKLVGVMKYGETNTWKLGIGNTTPRKSNLKATKPTTGWTADWTGDKEALILRPFESLQVKLNDTKATTAFQFFIDDYKTLPSALQRKDKIKTFDQSVQANGAPLAKQGKTSDVSNTYNTNSLYQLGIAVRQTNSSIDGQRMYLVASDQNVTGQLSNFEASYNDYSYRDANNNVISPSGFWLAQEAKDGTYDQGSYLFINAFNMNDYVGKPLKMIFYKNPNDSNTNFTLNFNLAEGSTLNDGLEKLSNGNKFYLVDSQEKKSFEITKGFEYNFTANENSNDRFTIYWNALPDGVLGTGDVEVNKNKTFIYKNNQASNSIRFAKKNLIANVKIFNMNGQLLSSKDKIPTSQDYTINYLENGMYVVQIQYSDDSIETLKSIFKK